jgi:hypothetical protein
MRRIVSSRFLIEQDKIQGYKAPNIPHPIPNVCSVDPQSNQQNLHRTNPQRCWRTNMDRLLTAWYDHW